MIEKVKYNTYSITYKYRQKSEILKDFNKLSIGINEKKLRTVLVY